MLAYYSSLIYNIFLATSGATTFLPPCNKCISQIWASSSLQLQPLFPTSGSRVLARGTTLDCTGRGTNPRSSSRARTSGGAHRVGAVAWATDTDDIGENQGSEIRTEVRRTFICYTIHHLCVAPGNVSRLFSEELPLVWTSFSLPIRGNHFSTFPRRSWKNFWVLHRKISKPDFRVSYKSPFHVSQC